MVGMVAVDGGVGDLAVDGGVGDRGLLPSLSQHSSPHSVFFPSPSSTDPAKPFVL